MKFENDLPFPRGKTACDGWVTPSADLYKDLAGRIYEVQDTVHGTGEMVQLRLVQASNAITAAKKFMKFSVSSALDFGRVISGVNDVQGGPCKPLDDAYPAGFVIPQYDYCYVVEKGPCSVLSSKSGINLTAPAECVSSSAGLIHTAAPGAGEMVCGRIDANVTVTNTAYVVHIDAGLSGGEGA